MMKVMMMMMTIIMILSISTDCPNRRAIFPLVLINYGENLAFSHSANSSDNDANIRQMSHDISDLTTKL